MIRDSAVAILCGGKSIRMGADKGLVPLCGKPMLLYVLEVCGELFSEIFVVLGSNVNKSYEGLIGDRARILKDKFPDINSPLVGAYTAFENCEDDYLYILSCDMPLVNTEVLRLMREVITTENAVIPRWPNGYIEPLHSIYRTKPSREAAKKALEENRRDIRSLLKNLDKVLYLSTNVIQQLDPKLETFFNVNTMNELKKAENRVKKRYKEKPKIKFPSSKRRSKY
ncbi:MAG: molybdenum cofactor guanylyltransferase [Candidatus Lokiarchaeia archaeon]